ncbi:MAG: response regulator transcription factor [Verrucomicrobiota bacterium]
MSDNRVKVALVEDNPETRAALHLLINGSPGFACIAACISAEEALAHLPALRPDVILMDIQLPGMSGIECIRQLTLTLPEAQVMMLTVFEDHERIFQSLAAGATGYVLKKTPPAKLLEAIQELHQGGAPMSGQIARQVIKAFQSQPANPSAVAVLSPREQEVLHLLAHGLLYKEIGDKLGISIGTVRVYIRQIYKKLHVNSRTEAVNRAFPRDY